MEDEAKIQENSKLIFERFKARGMTGEGDWDSVPQAHKIHFILLAKGALLANEQMLEMYGPDIVERARKLHEQQNKAIALSMNEPYLDWDCTDFSIQRYYCELVK